MDIAEAYRILELDPGVTPQQVQDAYRKKALRAHPDRSGGYGLHDKREWLRIRDAYEFLRQEGFPPLALEPAPIAVPPKGPKPYRAPEWLERRWAAGEGERFSDHLKLDEVEYRAAIRTLAWVVLIVSSMFLLFKARERLALHRSWSPRAGLSVGW